MIYYPLSTLMLARIRDILIISTPRDLPMYEELLGDGNQWGIQISYAAQPNPDGLAQAFIIGSHFIGNDNVSLVLGDNLFFGHGLTPLLRQAASREKGATIFTYWVDNPRYYGVASFDSAGNIQKITEKPEWPESSWAITGLYFYDNDILEIARTIKPSSRGELEISDINQKYLSRGTLNVVRMGRGLAWLDTGTAESLLEAAEFVRSVQHRQGQQIAALEEIAFRQGFISREDMDNLIQQAGDSLYGRNLKKLLDNPELLR